MFNLCQTCKSAYISDGLTIVQPKNGGIIVQNGSNNMTCTNPNPQCDIDMSGGKMEMKCKSYKPKNGIGEKAE